MNNRRRSYCNNAVFVLAVVLVLNTTTYGSWIYDFHIFNNPVYENDPRLNFSLVISDEGLTATGKQKVGFKFENNSTVSSSITDIYFDARPDSGSSLDLGSSSIIEGSGVSFSKYANPTTLPGGNLLTPSFDTYPEYSADADYSYFSDKGINPDEWLKLIFTLKYDRTIDDIISEIAAGGSYTARSLRVGIYIQSLPQDPHYDYPYDWGYNLPGCPSYSDSASAINCTQPIPEPAAITLLTLSLAFIRKNNKKSAQRNIS